MKVFEEFYDKATINKGVNAMFIIIIPKKEGASSLYDFCPIILVGNLYKIISL